MALRAASQICSSDLRFLAFILLRPGHSKLSYGNWNVQRIEKVRGNLTKKLDEVLLARVAPRKSLTCEFRSALLSALTLHLRNVLLLFVVASLKCVHIATQRRDFVALDLNDFLRWQRKL
jgi:hypothetical protein